MAEGERENLTETNSAGTRDHAAYAELVSYVHRVHEKCRRLLRVGIIVFFALPVFLAVMRYLAEMDKEITLIIWIICMFVLAVFLIFISYFDRHLAKVMEDINAQNTADRVDNLMLIEPIGPIAKKLIDYDGQQPAVDAEGAGE